MEAREYVQGLIDYHYNADALRSWSLSAGALRGCEDTSLQEKLLDFLRARGLALDEEGRIDAIDLSKGEALELKRAVEEWNFARISRSEHYFRIVWMLPQ